MLVSATYQHESVIGIGMSPHSWISFPLPTPPTALDCHRAPIWAPWVIQKIPSGYLILHMVRCMFQCYSFHLSHPLLPALCPQVWSLHLHLHCCPEHRFICTISTSLRICTISAYICLAAAAKLLQSCLTLCDPTDGSPPGSPIPGVRQALEWVAISFSNAWK